MRIAIGGFQHETNTFSATPTTWQDFALADTWPALLQDEALLSEMTPDLPGAPRNIPIAGFIDAALRSRQNGPDQRSSPVLLPTVWCAAGPSGRVTRDAFERITGMLIDAIAAAQADAVYLDLHGAMAAEGFDDADGEILRRVRAVIGEETPLVASLDLHANVSPLMFDSADMLIAYCTYPHVDMAATGARAFDWLQQLPTGTARAATTHGAWRRVPYLIPMCWQCTDTAPAKDLYALQQRLESDGALSVSLAMGFPAADVEKCGPSVWAYADSQPAAELAAHALLEAFNAAEAAFSGEILNADAAVSRAMKIATDKGGPVVIADAQDNPGAGGSADTTALLKALVAGGARSAVLGLLVDPQAARRAHAAGEGSTLRLSLGGKSGIAGDTPFDAEFRVERLHAGEVVASGSVFSGYHLTLGPSACLAIGGVRVVVISKAVQLLDLALLRFIGIEPAEQAIIAVKSTVHFRADFAPLASEILICAAPGAFLLDPAALPWSKLPAEIRRRPAR
jgi:microcystin degradation protein MlrC